MSERADVPSMSSGRTRAIAQRIDGQTVKERRSLGSLVIAPIVLMALVGLRLYSQGDTLGRGARGLLEVFAPFPTSLLTGVSFLREWAQGTLWRRTGAVVVTRRRS